MSRDEIRRAALALSREERIALSVELLEIDEPPEQGVDAAWLAEAARRDDELERGEVVGIDADAVLAELGVRLEP
jgi:hypothetical protein